MSTETLTGTSIQPYVFFSGRCEEALEFYRTAIGAEVVFKMRYKECPEPMPADRLVAGFDEKIMHSTVRIGDSTFMASDGCGDPTTFDGFSLSLNVPDEAEANRAFAALSEGGKVKMPLTRTFWSPCFGMLEDRFGMGWMVSVTA